MRFEADQVFDKQLDRLRLDLHTCSSGYAAGLLDTKLEEAYRYAVGSIEIIYGTPDRYAGSIKEVIDHCVAEGHRAIARHEEIHAGIVLWLERNPLPNPRNEEMCFSPITPEYDRSHWKSYSYLLPLYPYRETYSSVWISEQLGISNVLLLHLAKTGFRGRGLPDAKLVTVWDPEWQQNRKSWSFTRRDVDSLSEIVDELRTDYAVALADELPTHAEMNRVLSSLGKVVDAERLKRHAKSQLTKARKESLNE